VVDAEEVEPILIKGYNTAAAGPKIRNNRPAYVSLEPLEKIVSTAAKKNYGAFRHFKK